MGGSGAGRAIRRSSPSGRRRFSQPAAAFCRPAVSSSDCITSPPRAIVREDGPTAEAGVIAISIPIPLITVGWIAACVLIGLFAMSHGRSFVSWSLAAAIFSPLVVLLLFFLPKPNQTKQPPATPKPVAPPRLPAAARSNALPVKAIKALAYRVESSRIVGSISRRKAAANQSIENFAAAAEIDKGIAVAVRDEFPNEAASQNSTKRKTR